MPYSKPLDALLGAEEPHATFHDAALLRVAVDYARGEWAGTFEVVVGDPASAAVEERDRRRTGKLEVRGLKLWVLEPGLFATGGLWLSSDGALSEAPTEAGRAFAQELTSESVAWFLYFSDINRFGYLAGEQASFRWL